MVNKVTSTHVTNVTADNLAEEEFGTIGDGLPGPQRANILLSVFNLIREEKNSRWRCKSSKHVHL